MKSVIILIFLFFGCTISPIEAQTYKLNKQTYDHKLYIPQPDDPNNPTLMGVTSLFVPGLGQILTGETGRGLAFMCGTLVAYGMGVWALKSPQNETNIDDVLSLIFIRAMGGGLIIAGFFSHFWSIFDAVTVAKVNNMYFQDMNGKLSGTKIELKPFIDTQNYLGRINTSAGLSLKVTF